MRTRLLVGLVLVSMIACTTKEEASASNPDAAVEPVGPRAGEVGAPCARNADCDSSLCLPTGVCTRSCDTAMDCPETWACDALAGAGLICQCTISSEEETCDGLDNDCDGRVDTGAPCGDGLVCRGGECTCPIEQTCDGDCTDLTSNPSHCGACGQQCAAGEVCSEGRCAIDCGTAVNCSGSCVDPLSNVSHCGSCGNACATGQRCEAGACVCPAGEIVCGGRCVDPDSSPAHCGACANACRSGQVCSSGSCQCPAGTNACGSMCANVDADPRHCGSCGNACSSGARCDSGTCVCNPGTDRCGDDCVDFDTDSENCGSCGRRCTGGMTCSGGVCACPAGTIDCDGSCVDLQTDTAHCGACRVSCNPDQACESGACTCGPGRDECESGCVDLMSDDNNCGGCGHECNDLFEVCDFGFCVSGRCSGGRTRCDADTCADLNTDSWNCGACDRRCAAGQICSAGLCGSDTRDPGARCTTDGDCGTNGSCIREWSGGYCTYDCFIEDCPGDGVCVEIEPGVQYCLEDCSSNTDCRAGYTCDPMANNCLPPAG